MKKGYKECPFCANKIKEKAIKCQYCWEFLNKEEKTTKKEKNEKKECPFCMNKIDTTATVCPFCDEKINDKITKKEIWAKNTTKKQTSTDKISTNNELTKANNNIKTAFIFWCIWGWITLIVSLAQQDWWLLLWLLYFWVLLYFLYYKKNRMAALFLFIEYILDTIYSFMNWWVTWILGILILLWLFMGVLGTFSYHKIVNDTKLSTLEIITLVVCSLVTILVIMWLFSS